MYLIHYVLNDPMSALKSGDALLETGECFRFNHEKNSLTTRAGRKKQLINTSNPKKKCILSFINLHKPSCFMIFLLLFRAVRSLD